MDFHSFIKQSAQEHKEVSNFLFDVNELILKHEFFSTIHLHTDLIQSAYFDYQLRCFIIIPSGSAIKLVEALTFCWSTTFTRELEPSGTYLWLACVSFKSEIDIDLLVIIQANEVIDHTGSVVFNPNNNDTAN